MRTFESLNPGSLPQDFDAHLHGEEPIVDVQELEGRIAVSFAFPGFYRSLDRRVVDGKKVDFTQLNIAATGFFAESGKPLLPAFSRYVQIPPNCDYKVESEVGQAMKFDNVVVLPAQEMLTDNPEAPEIFEYDRDHYASDTLYPHEMVQVQGPFMIDDYKALLVTVVPFQYNAKKKQLLGYGNITLSIELVPSAVDLDEPPASPELNREGFGNFFLNPGRGITERLSLGAAIDAPVARVYGYEYLIIYYERFRAAAEQLMNWKIMKGLSTVMVSIDEVGNTVGAIKNYIRARRRSPGSRLRYVLFFGDVDMIVSEFIPGGPFGDNRTDYYYSTPRDAAGARDLVMPWISTGRIPVRNADQAADVVHQIIAYEMHPPGLAAFYKKMAFAGYFQGDKIATKAYVKTMETIRSRLVAAGYDVERIYVSQTGHVERYIDGAPVPADVVAAMVDPATATAKLVNAATEGRLMIAHRDHGSPDGWHMPPFSRADLNHVTGHMPSIFYSVNCLTGMFDLPVGAESFAEKLLRITRGAPSLIAATRESHTWLNDALMKGLFDAIWGGVLTTFPGANASYPVHHQRLGDILNYAKLYLPISLAGGLDFVKDHFEIYHTVGDPTLGVWARKPLGIRLQAQVIRRDLHIRLDRLPPDAVLTIWYGERFLRRLTPTSSYTRVSLPRSVWSKANQLSVCFWAPGCRFRRVKPKVARLVPDRLPTWEEVSKEVAEPVLVS